MNDSKSTHQIVVSHICTYFNFLNLALAVLVIISGQYKNMLFMGIVICNSLIGIVQELKVKKLIDALSVITATKAKRIAEDSLGAGGVDYSTAEIREIPIEDIQPGYLLRVAIGDQIVADGTVMFSDGLEINESLLTGESVPVQKKPGDVLYSGSHVVAGSGACRVTHVGEDNYATKLVKKAKTKKRASSEMQDSIKKIIRYVSFAIVPIGILLFCIQYFRANAGLSNSLVNTVAGVLGMIPEGLVLLTSISFILGVGRLAKKRALVQEMEAIEALARVNVLCLDKTGTITTGALSVNEIFPLEQVSSANAGGESGAGSSADAGGGFGAGSSADAGGESDLDEILSKVVFAFDDDNATSTALKNYLKARKKEHPPAHISTEKAALRRSVPFSSRRKFMGISPADTEESYVLGAPDFLTDDQSVRDQAENYGKKGLRVLLLASCRKLANIPEELEDIRPIALVTLTDEVKEDAPGIFRFFASQGVDVKIISGDNPATASAVGVRAGIPGAERYIDTAEWRGKSADDLKPLVGKYTVFGRVSPEIKQSIIKAYQKNEKVVGMVGDGVNDVLALKDADCGIAMAAGADAAKQSAHIVLMDSDFSSMREIVDEGRTVISNIERVSTLYLTKTIYSMLLCVIFIILGKSYPFIPIQLTLIGGTAIGIPSFILALEQHGKVTSGGFMKHVMRISLPAAVLLTVILVLIQLLAVPFSISPPMVRTLNLLAGGIISLGVVVRVCLPMNRVRLALCMAIAVMFFGAFLIMPEFFNIVPLTQFLRR